MLWLRQSTSVTIVLGPFLSTTDGFTPQTGLSVTPSTVRLSKNGGGFAAKADATNGTHMENGNYSVTLNATDTGTLGRLRIHANIATALPLWDDGVILPANMWDAMFASGVLQNVNVSSHDAGAITAAAFAANAITSTVLATDSISSAQIATGGAQEIAAAVKALVIETAGSYTLGQALSIMLAVLAGRTSSSGATIATPDGSATRVAATIDSGNNRTSMSLTPST